MISDIKAIPERARKKPIIGRARASKKLSAQEKQWDFSILCSLSEYVEMEKWGCSVWS
jgi:hypothetical protein